MDKLYRLAYMTYPPERQVELFAGYLLGCIHFTLRVVYSDQEHSMRKSYTIRDMQALDAKTIVDDVVNSYAGGVLSPRPLGPIQFAPSYIGTTWFGFDLSIPRLVITPTPTPKTTTEIP